MTFTLPKERLPPIDRVTIEQMTDDELDAAIAQRRERRLLAWEIWREGEESKKRARDERLKKQLGKQLDMATREFERVDKALDKLNERLSKIAGIRLELGDLL